MNLFIIVVKFFGSDESVVLIFDEDVFYFVIGGVNWDMCIIYIEGNVCFDCYCVGMSMMMMFMKNGWNLNEYMLFYDLGSFDEDFCELLDVWKCGFENVEGVLWIFLLICGEFVWIVGEDYLYC